MDNYREKLEQLQSKIEQRKNEKIRLEERLKTLQEEKEKLFAQMKELNIETLDQLRLEIEKLENEIKESISKCEKILN